MSAKILVHEDKNQIEKMVNCLNQFIPELNVLKIEFEKLKVGSFTNDVFIKIQEDKGENVITMYYDSINKELDKIGIENAITRTNLLKGHEEVVNDFKTKVNQLLNNLNTSFGFVELNLIQYENNKFVVPKQSIDLIKERCSYYIETKEEIKLYEALNNLFTATDIVKKSIVNLIGYELPEHIKTNDLIKDYFIKEFNSKLMLEPTGIRTFKSKFKTN